MTENETKTIDDCLKELKEHRDVYLKRSTPWRIVNRAVCLIEELKQYREIGTVEELQKLKGVIADFPLDCGSPIKSIAEIWNQLKKYLAIGTIEEFKYLKEKNTPKKVEYQGEHEKCPSCGSFHVFGNYCTECGQKIDFEKENKQ